MVQTGEKPDRGLSHEARDGGTSTSILPWSGVQFDDCGAGQHSGKDRGNAQRLRHA
jgi:hypothetical protein